MSKTVKSRISFSLQPKSVWQSHNPTLPAGTIGFEVSSDGSAVYGKVGNGETAYNDLPYLSNPTATGSEAADDSDVLAVLSNYFTLGGSA